MEYSVLVKDFAKRTRHNLEIIRRHKEHDYEAYEVTQLVNSLLGLIVLPKEKSNPKLPKTSLGALFEQGWPSAALQPTEGKTPENLRDLHRLLRNSVAHFNIEFSSKNENITGLELCNKCSCGSVTWKICLSLKEIDQLLECLLQIEEGNKAI